MHELPGHCVATENDTKLVTHLRFFSHPQISYEAPGTEKLQLIVGEKPEVLEYGT